MPALPTRAILTYTAAATGGLSPSGLVAAMKGVPLYSGLQSAPPPDAAFLPPGTSDAVFDVLFGANVINDVTQPIAPGSSTITRTLTLGLRPAAGSPTASSFVSLGNADPSLTATTNNPPFPAPVPPTLLTPAPPESLWVGCVVSSSPRDSGALGIFPGAVLLQVSFIDGNGNAGVETVQLDGRTPVPLAALKYQITEVTITSSGVVAPIGQVNFWSGPVDEVTGQPTGIVVGYLPASYFTNFSFQQFGGWTPGEVSDVTQAYALVPPDYNYPNQTVTGTPPPPPSKALLNYPPPSSVASPNPGSTPNALLTPAPNFTIANPYLTAVAGLGTPGLVPNPFQGMGLALFGQALSMPVARTVTANAVSMSVSFA